MCIDNKNYLQYYFSMDQKTPATETSAKSSSPQKLVVIIAAVVLVILIIVTFNFFNVLPISISVLPHQTKGSAQPKVNPGENTLNSNNSQATAEIKKCQF